MLAILSTTGRVLWRHWPALLVWFIAGVTARYFIIWAAGFVGGQSATLGMLILPLGALARLVSYIGMFLVIRDGLSNLQRIAPPVHTAQERRTEFLNTLLASILPFFVVYVAAGYLAEDASEYALIALDRAFAISLGTVATGAAQAPDSDVALEVSFGPWTVLIVAIAYAGRWAWKKWSTKMPRAFALGAVYLEVIWVAFAVALIQESVGTVGGWVESRVAMVWLTDLRAWVTDQLVAVAWIWDAIEWLLGEAGGIILQPLAWLTVAGVIYGQTIVAETLKIESRLIERAKARAEHVPSAVRRRAGDFADEFTSRFRPIGRAILLMWRAGPVTTASYILLYTAVLAIAPLLEWGIILAIGPQDFTVWRTFSTLIVMGALMIAETVRIALIGAAYDLTLSAMRQASQLGSIENLTNLPSSPVPPSPSGSASSGATLGSA